MAEAWTFEKAMARLEQIVGQLEGGRCTLDDSLKLFEEGTKLTAFCTKKLKEAEQKITRLTAGDVKSSKSAAEPAEDAGAAKTAANEDEGGMDIG